MLKYLRLVFTAGLRILWDWLFYILRYAKHPERYPLEKRYAKVHKLIVYVVDCYRVDFKVKGLEHLRRLEASDKPYLMCANHESNMDPIVMLYFCEKPISFVAKKETEKFPFVGKIIKSIDGLFMDRDDLRQSLRVMIELGKRLENGKLSYLIFPEGTRNKDMDKSLLLPYKPGALKAAKKAGVAILPSCMYGNERILPMRPNDKRIPVELTFFEPLDQNMVKENDTEAIAEKVMEITEAELKLQIASNQDFFEKGYQKIPRRKGKLR